MGRNERLSISNAQFSLMINISAVVEIMTFMKYLIQGFIANRRFPVVLIAKLVFILHIAELQDA